MSTATFPLVPRSHVIGLAFGGMRSVRRGLGTDIASSRPYRPGDDVKAIDWAASARISSARGTDEFVVREYFADESPRVVVVADRRPTLVLAPPPRNRLLKARVLEAAVDLIEASAVHARSLLGYLDYADGSRFWQAPRSEHHGTLERGRPFAAPQESLAAGLEELTRQRRDLPTGTFVFVISDFLDLPPRPLWARLVEQQWDVVPVIVQDPVWERSFPELSGVVVEVADPATGRRFPVRLSAAESRSLREEHEARWEALLADLAFAGLTPVVLDSNDPADISAAFLRWADQRLDRRGGAA